MKTGAFAARPYLPQPFPPTILRSERDGPELFGSWVATLLGACRYHSHATLAVIERMVHFHTHS